MKKKKEVKISYDEKGRPDKIVCKSSADFFAAMARKDAGEFTVPAMAQGGDLGLWILDVIYPRPKQGEMFE